MALKSLKELLENDDTPIDARVLHFNSLMLQKFRLGREEHGTRFVADPVEEAKKECIDLACYAMVIHSRLEKIQQLVPQLELEEKDE